MKFVYFSKLLQELDVPALIAFCQEVGLDGVDLAVRPGYPVNPENCATALSPAAKRFREAGLSVGLVSAPTNLNDPGSATARRLIDACGAAGVPFLKIGYFPYAGNFRASVTEARRRLAGWGELGAKANVRVCYHTHSGGNLGNNAAGLRLLLDGLDPHHVGAFADTGHLSLHGGPIRMELDILGEWFCLLAIKDMAWDHGPMGWRSRVVPAGQGIVRWDETAKALKDARFAGTVSLHGEYETKDLKERKELARQELSFLKRQFA
jgi:sugar phosphate isomerase/epimerase